MRAGTLARQRGRRDGVNPLQAWVELALETAQREAYYSIYLAVVAAWFAYMGARGLISKETRGFGWQRGPALGREAEAAGQVWLALAAALGAAGFFRAAVPFARLRAEAERVALAFVLDSPDACPRPWVPVFPRAFAFAFAFTFGLALALAVTLTFGLAVAFALRLARVVMTDRAPDAPVLRADRPLAFLAPVLFRVLEDFRFATMHAPVQRAVTIA